jgi:hypothetical protein
MGRERAWAGVPRVSFADADCTLGYCLAVPPGLRVNVGFANPTLKRGANNHCAFGAGTGCCWDGVFLHRSI